MNIEFQSIDELKQRVMPALRVRKRELKKKNIKLTEDEIWNYFIESSWKIANNLSLKDIVDDILNKEIILKHKEDII